MVIIFKRTFIFFCLILISHTSANSLPTECISKPIKPQVVLAIPSPKGSAFWDEVVSIAEKASLQLQINLKVYYLHEGEGKRFTYIKFIDQALTKEVNAEYLITFFVSNIEQSIVDIAEKHHVKLLTFNSPFTKNIENILGKPREKSSNWIAHLSTDEMQTGYDLADFLITKKQQNKQKINLLAINGSDTANITRRRILGLQTRVQEDANITLLQIVKTNWDYVQTRKKISLLLKRFPHIDVIWCASDTIARAVVDEIKESNPELLNKVVIGGIDWSQKIIPYIENNDIDVSFGGHVFDIVHVLTLIYDYHNGIDFNTEIGVVIKNQNSPLSGGNYQALQRNKYNTLNFRIFSKCHTPKNEVKKYSAHELLNTAIISTP